MTTAGNSAIRFEEGSVVFPYRGWVGEGFMMRFKFHGRERVRGHFMAGAMAAAGRGKGLARWRTRRSSFRYPCTGEKEAYERKL